jgi:5-(carboxyamino)imidazole ribonucleotide synthase
MVNLIGALPPLERILAIPGTHVHLYDKAPRPGRKLGHVNVLGESPAAVREALERVEEALESVLG